ncbi:protein stum homolog isoform X1 [Amphibalanus amphitrite]|uniref:protein stum homolog isoform X1 n=1 Tax=Amphibalanus amphitrite TaxID=1232801 RepID=UPI001C90997D|nr:protein stum homolog isoform X1 [Amphibalanus amphitrite]XP_043243192.1 protein stum homolog isoform X1 [Amphibalanus amphitrite]
MDTVPSLTFTPAGDEERTPSPTGHQRRSSHERRGSQNLLQSAGIGIEKRRRSSTSTYRIENNQVLYENDDGQTERMEIVKIHEKHGCFRKSIPYMPMPVALLLCVLNVVTPSIGTFLSGLMVFCWGPSEYPTRRETLCWSLLTGLLQLITLPIVVGWIWSIKWGVAFVQESMSKSINSEKTAETGNV